jgi:hypothetical protein
MENELRVDLPAGTFTIELRDLTGRLVATRTNCTNNCTIAREGWASGMYELIVTGEGLYTRSRLAVR